VSSVPFLPSVRVAQEQGLCDAPVGSRPHPGMGDPMDTVGMAEPPSGAASPG
jgi:hypothetical protein